MANLGQGFGYLVLFDSYGNAVPATPEDLLSIEAKSFDKAAHLRAVNHQSGQYWLISDRLGFFPALVRVSIFRCYPRTPENVEWSISYSEDGEASYPEFDIEWVIAALSRSTGFPEWVDNPRAVPENVAAIARERVRYRLGHSTDEASKFDIRPHDAVTMQANLTQYLEVTTDPSELIRNLAGHGISVGELLQTVAVFTNQHGIDHLFDNILAIIVPEDQHERLGMLIELYKRQMGYE
jgi:hypothetical protein